MEMEEYSIEVYIQEDVYSDIVAEVEKQKNVETGGLLFGTVKVSNNLKSIFILREFTPPDHFCIRERAYFEISPGYAKGIVENESLTYLGNWHKHLGYGGPSSGDYHQIEEFFEINDHLDRIIAMIIDSSDSTHTTHIEFYERIQDNNDLPENSPLFNTYKVSPHNFRIIDDITDFIEEIEDITDFKEDFDEFEIQNDVVIADTEISKEEIINRKILQIKTKIFEQFKPNLSEKEIKKYEGRNPDEQILGFPIQYDLKDLVEVRTNSLQLILNLKLLISFPNNYPNGEIYVDLASADITRLFTIETYPSAVLDDVESINNFILSIKNLIENKIPSLLDYPLWKILDMDNWI